MGQLDLEVLAAQILLVDLVYLEVLAAPEDQRRPAGLEGQKRLVFLEVLAAPEVLLLLEVPGVPGVPAGQTNLAAPVILEVQLHLGVLADLVGLADPLNLEGLWRQLLLEVLAGQYCLVGPADLADLADPGRQMDLKRPHHLEGLLGLMDLEAPEFRWGQMDLKRLHHLEGLLGLMAQVRLVDLEAQ
jgi:hypothetical protein